MTAKRRDGWNVPSRFVSRYFPPMISYTTVQELIDGGYKLHAHCHNSRCQHNQKIDLVRLRERLGPDHSTNARPPRAKADMLEMRRQADRPHQDAAFELDWLDQSLHQVEGSANVAALRLYRDQIFDSSRPVGASVPLK